MSKHTRDLKLSSYVPVKDNIRDLFGVVLDILIFSSHVKWITHSGFYFHEEYKGLCIIDFKTDQFDFKFVYNPCAERWCVCREIYGVKDYAKIYVEWALFYFTCVEQNYFDFGKHDLKTLGLIK